MYVLLTLLGPFFLQTFGCIREENARSSYFNIKQNQRLTGHTIRTTTADCLVVCGKFCLREANCFSFNFKTRGRRQNRVCELNGRVLNTGNQRSLLVSLEFIFELAMTSLQRMGFPPNFLCLAK